jgi:hypothetical protein
MALLKFLAAAASATLVAALTVSAGHNRPEWTLRGEIVDARPLHGPYMEPKSLGVQVRNLIAEKSEKLF